MVTPYGVEVTFAKTVHIIFHSAVLYVDLGSNHIIAGMANTDFAYHIGAAYSVYTKNANRWVIGGEYLHKKYDYKDMRIPVEQFTAEGGYYLKFLSDRRKTFFLSLGLSALAGYETSNRGDKLLSDEDCFIYGGALTLELEAYLTDRVALLVNARERMLFGSDIGKFHTQVGLGLKFIIN